MNSCILIGRLTADPEIRTTPNGIQVASFTLAVNRTFKNANGEREADFIRCIGFKKTAELIGQYTRKGSQIGVNGRIQTGSYENQQGQRVYTTDVIVNEVQFLDSKQDNQSNQYQSSYQAPNNYQSSNQEQNYHQGSVFNQNDYNPSVDISEDDLPF